MTRCRSEAKCFRGEMNGKLIEFRIGYDGQIWTWLMGRGQVTLARSDEALKWIEAHVLAIDREDAIRACVTPEYKPSIRGLDEGGRGRSSHTKPLEV